MEGEEPELKTRATRLHGFLAGLHTEHDDDTVLAALEDAFWFSDQVRRLREENNALCEALNWPALERLRHIEEAARMFVAWRPQLAGEALLNDTTDEEWTLRRKALRAALESRNE